MSAIEAQFRGSKEPRTTLIPANPAWLIIRMGLLCVLAGIGFWLAFNLANDGNWFLAITLMLTTLGAIIINLVPGLWPLRWMTPSLVLVALVAVYPLLYTVYIAFTNYRAGHFFTKAQVIERLQTDREYLYVPEGGTTYSWTPFVNENQEYALWLEDRATGNVFFAPQGQARRQLTAEEIAGGAPDTFEGYSKLSRLRFYGQIGGDKAALELRFGDEDYPVGIKEAETAGVFMSRWAYDSARDVLTDQLTNLEYIPDDVRGSYVAKTTNPDGSPIPGTLDTNGQPIEAPLGYWALIGLSNFDLLFRVAVFDGTMLRIFLWTVAFAFFSVVSAFALGLMMALVLNQNFRGVRIIRSILLIPYAIPGMISILIWRGMLNPNVGVLMNTLKNTLGIAPADWDWTTSPFWAKFMILLVNLWLAYPYFMLICSGALQSISSSIYEAAEVDGATAWDKFWKLTLPLLLVAVGPLLIASFTFNFNNFMLIEALTGGGPAMQGVAPPVPGHTDNLITYTYRYAFSGSAGSGNYSFASAIAIFNFFLVGALTLVQFRLTKRWEEVGENV